MEGEVYQRKERVKVIGKSGLDLLVEDQGSGKQYYIDAGYFRSQYEPENTQKPLASEVSK